MSVERVNDSKIATEVQSSKDNNIMEDTAIGIQDTQYSADDDSKSFESSFQYQQHIDNSQFEESSNHEMICEDDMDKYNKNIPLPKSIPVGSSDDSCCSDSTESSIGMSSGSGRNCSTDTCDSLNKNFITYRYTEIVLLLTGLAVCFFFKSNAEKSFWVGLGVALAIEAAISLGADYFAERRATDYTIQLKEFVKPK